MVKKCMAAFLAAVLLANSTITGLAAAGSGNSAGNGIEVSTEKQENRGQTGSTAVTPTDSDAEKPEAEKAEIRYTVLPEELEDKAEVDGPEEAVIGKSLKFSVKPEDGYEIESVTADGSELEGNKTLLGNTFRYELEEVTGDHDIEITLCEKNETGTKQPQKTAVLNSSRKSDSNAVYVSENGNDTTGDGSEEKPFATLAKAVKKIGTSGEGGTIEVLTDLEAEAYTFIGGSVEITIDGNGNTIRRAEGFARHNDLSRGAYNPALIEVANGAKLILRDITLDDCNRTEAEKYEEQLTGEGDKKNEERVQDAIIAAYGDGKGTIVLGSGATLKNFGGMSAVRIGGNTDSDGQWYGSTLIMEPGSQIIDDALGEDGRKGGFGAVWSQGGYVEMQESSSICNIDGRVLYSEDGGTALINGEIANITSNNTMKYYSGASNGGFGGIVAYAEGKSKITLGETGAIREIASFDQNSADVAFLLVGSTYEMLQGSSIKDINTIGLIDSNESRMIIDGEVSNCHTKKVFFRMRGGGETVFELGENGLITESSTTDAGIIYLNGGKPVITISGEISNITAGEAIFISNNGSKPNGVCTVTETGKIKNITGTAILAGDPSKVSVNGGEISGCGGYAIHYGSTGGSLVEINEGSRIEGNRNGKAQIYVKEVQKIGATDLVQHVKIASGTLIGNQDVDLPSGTVTLDEEYADVGLGNAGSEAADRIKEEFAAGTEHEDWTVVSENALWLKPSENEIHFTIERPGTAKKTGLFAAYVALNADGKPEAGENVQLMEVENTDPIDVTLSGLTPDTAYALMFVNNAEYTLSPDDITIYTGGGQGAETSETGFPEVTLTGSVDKITALEVNGNDTGLSGDEAMEYLLSLFHVTYMDTDGTVITDDTEAGEYKAVLEPNDPGMQIRINGNEIAGYETGTLIVRYTADIEDAQSGNSTYPLASEEPAEAVEHAVAVSKKWLNIREADYYINNDEDREISDTSGISLLDDSLLLEDESDRRQYLMEQRAEKFLGAPSDPAMGYKYDFHYLDLVDANNGNAWVSASYGSVVYLPYPEGTDASTEFHLIHFQDLHREYGISGQAEVEEAIRGTRVEEMTVEKKDAGLRFETERAGFSPFALVWEVPQNSVTIQYLDAEDNSAIANPVIRKFETGTAYDVTEETEKTFQGYTPDRVEGTVKGSALNEDIIIRVYYKKVVVPPTEYTITIRYMDKESGMEIAAPAVLTYQEGTAYDVTEEAGKEISGYTLDHVDGNVKGDSLNSDMEIRVFYSKNEVPPAEYTITVNYLEKTSQKKLAEPFVTTAAAGSAYDVSEQAGLKISGYVLSGVEGNVKGEHIDGNVVIRVYYVADRTDSDDNDDDDSGRAVYTVGTNGNWVHVDPENTNAAISGPVPEGATPTTAPEYHQWKFILNNGTAVSGKWAYVKNPYAVGDQPKEGWFYFNARGIMQYGWFFDTAAQKWYYLHRNSDGMLGTMMEGWHYDDQDGKWYYLKPGSGEMLTGWQEIGGKWYYLSPDPVAVTWDYNSETGGWTYNGTAARPFGSMYSNEITPDGYRVDDTGAWVK